jgi:hypothetical protein
MLESLTGARPIMRSEINKRKSVDANYPTGNIVDVCVTVPKSVYNFLFSAFRITGRAPATAKE